MKIFAEIRERKESTKWGKTGIWIRSRVKHTLAKCVAGLHMSISLNGIDLKIDLR